MNTLNDHQQALLQQLLHSGTARSDLEMILTAFPAQEWDQMLQNQRRVIRTGANVVLVNGIGKKRKFNGCQAHVIEYPQSGSWMTVQIRSEDTSSVVKWRKQGYVRAADSLRFEDLNDDALAHIFGYFDHGIVDENDPTNSRDRLLWARDAARLHTLIASISHTLRRFASSNLVRVVGHLDANFDGLNDKCVIPCIRWLCQFKLRLGRVKIRYQLADVPLVCWLLSECDTDSLLYVQALDALHFGHVEARDCIQSSGLVEKAWWSRFSASGATTMVDLTGGASSQSSLEDMTTDLCIPFKSTTCRKELYDAIAENCPNVSHLRLGVKVPPASNRDSWARRNFSTALFAMASIRHLDLSLSIDANYASRRPEVDIHLLQVFMRGLVNLEELKIGCHGRLVETLYQKRVHIESTTLRVLNVERMPKNTWVSCVCPSLERYICMGEHYGNGTRPNFTPEQIFEHGGDVLRADSVQLIGLEVPGGCECFLKGFPWNHYREYFPAYQWVLDNVRSAQLWTHTESGAG